MFNGLNLNLGNLPLYSNAKSHSLSAENPTGEKGKGAMAEPEPNGPARTLGRGWKCRPCIKLNAGETATIADIAGPGALQSMWFGGHTGRWMILRIFWDGQDQPAVECPISDFHALPWLMSAQKETLTERHHVNSLPVAVNPNKALNNFWVMPFRKHCRITIENIAHFECVFYWQINYTLTDVPDDALYFHAQFRRVNPLPYGEAYTILDGVRGRGHYVGTVMGVGVNSGGWWGEGEIKFVIDGDGEFPTICGTGTEDYFGGSYDWEIENKYVTYTTPFLGMHQVLTGDGTYRSQHRHAMYRWHIMDPVRFEQDLRVTIQVLKITSDGRFMPAQHDICSVAYWYQTLPAAPFPKLPDKDYLEIV